MFPITITLHSPAQLNAVLAALQSTTNAVVSANLAAETAMADTVDAKPTLAAEAPGKSKAKPSAAPTAPSQPTAEAAPSQPAPSDAAPEAPTTATEPAAAAPSAPPPDDAAPFDYTVLQKAVNERVAKFGKDALLAIATKHGAATFKALDASKWAAAHADVVALG